MTKTFPVDSGQLKLHPWQNDELYRLLFAEASDPIYLVHPETGQIIDCNKTAAQLDGYDAQELAGMHLTEVWQPCDTGVENLTETELLLPGLKAGLDCCDHKRKDGGLVPVELNSRLVRFQDQEFILCVERDITVRKQAEAALRDSEIHYRTLAESAQDFIFIVGPDDRILYLNEFAASQVGLRPTEMMGKPRCDFFPMELSEEQRQGLRSVFDGASTLSCESRAHLSDRTAWLSTSFTPLTDERGEVTAVLGISRDITEQKMAAIQVQCDKDKLEESNRDLAILFDISSAISREMEIGKLLNQALKMIVELGLLEVQRKGGIFIIDDDRMRLAAHIGHDEAFIKAHENFRVGECICGRVALSGKNAVSPNSDREEHHSIEYPGMKPHGHVIIPLRTGDNTVGVLFLYLPPDRGIKDRQLKLLMAIGNQLAVAIEKIRLYEKTRELSLHDPLTGLANRHFMAISLRSAMAAAKRTGRPFSLIMMDLDHFKEYNDTYGHVAADKLLSDVSRLMSEEVREVDLVARYGGEEFLVVLPDTDESDAIEVAERVRSAIAQSEFSYSRHRPPTRMTVSAGVSTFDSSVSEEDVLVARADSALYTAKNSGRNRVMSWLTV